MEEGKAKRTAQLNAHLANAQSAQINAHVPNAQSAQLNAHLPNAQSAQTNAHLTNAPSKVQNQNAATNYLTDTHKSVNKRQTPNAERHQFKVKVKVTKPNRC